MFEEFETSNEAVQTLASVYNSGKLTVNELNVTGTSSFTGASTMTSLNLLPRGIIVAWNTITAPTGWALCDGQNGTPDLRNRFILGAGSRALNAIGGAETHTLTIDEIPSHAHGIQSSTACFKNGGCDGRRTLTRNETPADNYTTEGNGGGNPHNNMPPFFVLAYIMKL